MVQMVNRLIYGIWKKTRGKSTLINVYTSRIDANSAFNRISKKMPKSEVLGLVKHSINDIGQRNVLRMKK